VAGLLIAGIIGFILWRKSGPSPIAANGNLVTVAVAKVTLGDLADDQVFWAEFPPYQEIDLHAKVAGL